MDTKELMLKIEKAARAKEDAEAKKKLALEEKVSRLENEVDKIVFEDLDGLVEVGQALFDAKFLPAENNRLIADGYDHKVGFCGKTTNALNSLCGMDKKVTGLAWIGGGCCGDYDIVVRDGGICYVANAHSDSAKHRAPTMTEKACMLQSFLKGYEVFRKDLDAFVEELPV